MHRIHGKESGAVVMSLPVIGAVLAALGVTIAAIQLYISFPKLFVAKRSEFYCALSPNPTEGGENWAVMYRNGRGHTKVWLRMVRSMGKDSSGRPFDPQRRCEEVVEKMKIYKADGLIAFDYRPDPATPNQYVVCAKTRASADNCPQVLTLMPEDDPYIALREIMGALLPGNPESLQSSGPITPENPKIISLEGQL